jgi:hypothetical protein
MPERRTAPRRLVDVFFNKFLDGQPYLCRAIDISRHGLSCDVFIEPKTTQKAFPIEIRLPEHSQSLWMWGRKVRALGRREAIRFVALHDEDRVMLDRFLTPCPD